MASTSSIEWTNSTWNPVTGCTKVSPGCQNCYAERLAKRLQAMGNPTYRNGFRVTMHPRLLQIPLGWRRPRMIFVNSMSDLFHEDVPAAFIQAIIQIMRETPRHTYQVLTKRAQRLREMSREIRWPDNVWVGVSVEDSDHLHRIEFLRQVDCAISFLSLEPLLGPLSDLDLAGIDWAIVGGESGPKARPMCEEWVLEIRDLCEQHDVPFFFKQWGGVNKKKTGRVLEGRTYSQMPQSQVLVPQ